VVSSVCQRAVIPLKSGPSLKGSGPTSRWRLCKI